MSKFGQFQNESVVHSTYVVPSHHGHYHSVKELYEALYDDTLGPEYNDEAKRVDFAELFVDVDGIIEHQSRIEGKFTVISNDYAAKALVYEFQADKQHIAQFQADLTHPTNIKEAQEASSGICGFTRTISPYESIIGYSMVNYNYNTGVGRMKVKVMYPGMQLSATRGISNIRISWKHALPRSGMTDLEKVNWILKYGNPAEDIYTDFVMLDRPEDIMLHEDEAGYPFIYVNYEIPQIISNGGIGYNLADLLRIYFKEYTLNVFYDNETHFELDYAGLDRMYLNKFFDRCFCYRTQNLDTVYRNFLKTIINNTVRVHAPKYVAMLETLAHKYDPTIDVDMQGKTLTGNKLSGSSSTSTTTPTGQVVTDSTQTGGFDTDTLTNQFNNNADTPILNTRVTVKPHDNTYKTTNTTSYVNNTTTTTAAVTISNNQNDSISLGGHEDTTVSNNSTTTNQAISNGHSGGMSYYEQFADEIQAKSIDVLNELFKDINDEILLKVWR